MDSLRTKIQEDMRNALLAKDMQKAGALRMLYASIRNKEIALRKGVDVELGDEQIVEIVQSEIKSRRDSIVSYEQGGRPELAEKEQKEIDVISVYLPVQLTDDEISSLVREVIGGEDIAGLNIGKVMGAVMQKAKGKADGARVSEAVKKALGK